MKWKRYQLIGMGAHAAHRPAPFIRIGRTAVNAAYAGMRLLIALRLMKDRGVTRENLGSVLRTVHYDGSKITRMFGFRYTPLTETVTRVVQAYRRRT